MMRPSSFAVFALKFLQKSMMFTPCSPSAVPTGGAGVALPAGICSFTIAFTFFAIFQHRSLAVAAPFLYFLHLQEIQFHGRRAAENRNQHAKSIPLRIDLVHLT